VSDDEWEVFELVVRRFYATVADAAVWEHLKVVAEVDDDCRRLKANGKRLVEPGYHDVYPYFSTTENFVPDVDEGEELAFGRRTRGQTDPAAPTIRPVAAHRDDGGMGIGTKCLTAETDVLHRDTDGDVVRAPVSELFDDGAVVMADGDTEIAINERGPTSLSVDEATERVTEREQTLSEPAPARGQRERPSDHDRNRIAFGDIRPPDVSADGRRVRDRPRCRRRCG